MVETKDRPQRFLLRPVLTTTRIFRKCLISTGDSQRKTKRLILSRKTEENSIYVYFIIGLWYNRPMIKLFLEEIDDLKKKLDHITETLRP